MLKASDRFLSDSVASQYEGLPGILRGGGGGKIT